MEDFAYEIQGHTISMQHLHSFNYDEATNTLKYELDDRLDLSYEFAFKGTTLTLSANGKSVTMNAGYNYFMHHSLAIFIYGMFVLSLLSGKGFLARFFCIPLVRRVGRASFYPYLIHLPIITFAWGICNLNCPKNTILLLIFIYTVSTLYMEFKIWRRKKNK